MVSALSSVATADETSTTALSAGDRVDLYTPTFSNPLNITNPLFPKGPAKLSQTIELGYEPDTQLRLIATQLDQIRTVRWKGKDIQTRVTHYLAFHNGRIAEIAYDFYAQDDKGAVWYFGEEVSNFEDGVLLDHDGAWLAGVDGPPGMIMPANPQVGDVFRPEDAAPEVFEQATVEAVNLTVAGPSGSVRGAARLRLELLDGTVEKKIFAPGYGEFRAEVAAVNELYFVALAVPTDDLAGPVPAALAGLTTGANRVFTDAANRNWSRAGTTTDQMTQAWASYVESALVPRLLEDQMDVALGELKKAVRTKKSMAARQAALNVSTAALDVQLRYRSQDSVDTERLEGWRKQLQLDTLAGDEGAVAGDRITINAIRAGINQ